MDVWAYFRFTSLSVLLGFAFFCLSYATWVWRRRQAARSGPPLSLRMLLGKWSRGLLLAGGGLAVVGLIVWGVVPTRGVMRLHESFAARARAEVGVSYLAPKGPIKTGDVLVRFAPGSLEAEIAALQAHHEQLSAEYDKTEAMPLEIDEELTREHQNALSRLEQSQVALNNLVPLLKETVRIGLEKKLDRVDRYVAMDRLIIDYEATRKQSLSEYEFRYQEFQRISKLASNQGVITDNEYELKKHEIVSVAEQVKKLEKSLEQFRRETEQLKSNTIAFEQLVSQQAESLGKDVQRFQADQAAAEQELTIIAAAIARDQLRAKKQRAAELRMVAAEMQEIQANIRSLQEGNVLLAPYDGEVVYRSAAPNSVEEHGVVLVMAHRSTAEVQFSLPQNQVQALQKTDRLDIWVEDSALATRLTGRVIETEKSPVHEDHMIATVACQPPMDILPMLANEQLIPIQLTWQPPLLTVPVIQLALCLITLGSIGCVLTWNRKRSQAAESTPVEQNEQVSQEQQILEQIQSQQFGLHHGSLGAMLQMLGNKFREALFEGAIDADLISSVEWALDRHQGRGLKMLRQSFVSSLTAEENLEERLELALNQLVDQGTVDSELYDRLIAILNVLDVANAHSLGSSLRPNR